MHIFSTDAFQWTNGFNIQKNKNEEEEEKTELVILKMSMSIMARKTIKTEASRSSVSSKVARIGLVHVSEFTVLKFRVIQSSKNWTGACVRVHGTEVLSHPK